MKYVSYSLRIVRQTFGMLLVVTGSKIEVLKLNG